MTTWAEAQEAELAWWEQWTDGRLWASIEQMEMARRMGLEVDDRYTIHTAGTIWDIGGGPVSLLLKSVGWDRAVVVDPAPYPDWTVGRYNSSGIEVWRVSGEEALASTVDKPDEVWMYNTLQHVEDPQALVTQAILSAPVVRLFDWVEEPVNECHIHVLHADEIERWAIEAGADVTGGAGVLNDVLCYVGVFR